jgi:hypothetical protein
MTNPSPITPVGTAILEHTAQGWAVESMGDTWLSFIGPMPQRTNHVVHGILSPLIPFYFIVWILVAVSDKRAEREHLQYTVHNGTIDMTQGRYVKVRV